MTHTAVREMLVDAIYGELSPDDRQQFDEHLNTCETCTREFEQLKGVATTMSLRERQELSPEDWKAFWNVLSAGISAVHDTGSSKKTVRWNLIDRLSPTVRLAAGAVLLLVVGIAIGRFVGGPGIPPSDTRGSSPNPTAEQVALHRETMDYLEKSKILLLGIVNTEGELPEKDQFSRQREVSRVLVSRGSDLKSRLNKSGQQQLEGLVDDLEVLLLQIANLEMENDFPGLEIIRGGVDRKGILLKINVEEMKAQQQRTPVPSDSKSQRSRSMI